MKRSTSILTIVACVLFIAWTAKLLVATFETRKEYASVLQSTDDKQNHRSSEIMRGKRLHGIHVEAVLMSAALFGGLSIVTLFRMRTAPPTAKRANWISLCFTVGVAAVSLLSVGNVSWDTLMLEFILIGQIAAAALPAAVCVRRDCVLPNAAASRS